MKGYIGNKLINTLKPNNKQYDVRDSKLPGFLIRVNPSGKMKYVCQYQRGRRISIGDVGILTPAQARDKAIAILNDAVNNIYPHETKSSNILTLKSFINDYYSDWFITHRKSGQKTIDHINRTFTKAFGSQALSDFTPAQVDKWRTQRLKQGKSIETVNRDIATFKAALSKAVLWGLIDKHPLEKFKLLKSDRNCKIRYLTQEEEKRLRNATLSREDTIRAERQSANEWRKARNYEPYPDLSQYEFADYLRPMIIISINTGMRQGELFSLEWRNIDFDRKVLTIEGAYAKSGKTRHIPLNSEAFSTLTSWRKQTDGHDFVFPSKGNQPFNNVKRSWKTILESAAISNFRWHDMRHHFASRLVMAGVDLNTVRELLGHSDLKMTLRYAHLAPEHKANAVEKLINNVN